MSKAVLISIRPKWCDLIASGHKTIEVRKTRPQIKTPFKCYIYCTNSGDTLYSVNGKVQPCNSFEINLKENSRVSELNGYVIGKFVCNRLELFTVDSLGSDEIQIKACLSYEELISYFYKQEELDGNTLKLGYGWHISELVIYEKPKKLSEFTPCCKFMLDEKQCDYRKVKCLNQQDSFMEEDGCNCLNFVRRPPMSWCYVEELTI